MGSEMCIRDSLERFNIIVNKAAGTVDLWSGSARDNRDQAGLSFMGLDVDSLVTPPRTNAQIRALLSHAISTGTSVIERT